jgi:hypothetical protein
MPYFLQFFSVNCKLSLSSSLIYSYLEKLIITGQPIWVPLNKKIAKFQGNQQVWKSSIFNILQEAYGDNQKIACSGMLKIFWMRSTDHELNPKQRSFVTYLKYFSDDHVIELYYLISRHTISKQFSHLVFVI